ncbi:hypothetical protein R1T16_01645 [Flavobacterium sp. DG1-102-2]|uniref:hypothetical protein n=1 Tax=Flavobacterium sp. DG1-102-2 TaxID=3081663 RepID=UPI0029498272|nr:hypothetical protein [Flavobacterium sp. DG1-102-2]MDV6167109.1 hypothetical protein [Flavobacterium sp. DG1-102-2]
MANYLVILYRAGKIDFSLSQDQAMIEAHEKLVPHLQHNEFEFISVEPWTASDSASAAIHHPFGEESVILKIKIKLNDLELQSTEAIMNKIKARMLRGHFYLEEISNAVHGSEQLIFIFSELQRHHRYTVAFHYMGALESIEKGASEDEIIKEIQMLLQAGEMALGHYDIADIEDLSGTPCEEIEISGNETIIKVHVMINEFNIDFDDSESIYYYVLGELDGCGCRLRYKYTCEGSKGNATFIGVSVHCSYQPLAIDDYDDLIQQL